MQDMQRQCLRKEPESRVTKNSSARVSAQQEVHRGCKGEMGKPYSLCGKSWVVRKDFTEKVELELRIEAIEQKRIMRIV